MSSIFATSRWCFFPRPHIRGLFNPILLLCEYEHQGDYGISLVKEPIPQKSSGNWCYSELSVYVIQPTSPLALSDTNKESILDRLFGWTKKGNKGKEKAEEGTHGEPSSVVRETALDAEEVMMTSSQSKPSLHPQEQEKSTRGEAFDSHQYDL